MILRFSGSFLLSGFHGNDTWYHPSLKVVWETVDIGTGPWKDHRFEAQAFVLSIVQILWLNYLLSCSIFQLKESVHLDLENMKTRIEDVDLNNRVYLEREHAEFDKQLSDFHSATASLKLRMQDIETKNEKVTSLIEANLTWRDGQFVFFVLSSNYLETMSFMPPPVCPVEAVWRVGFTEEETSPSLVSLWEHWLRSNSS